MEGTIRLSDDLIETLFQCTGCASCSTNCPSGVKVSEIIKTVRKDMVHMGKCHPAFAGIRDVLQMHSDIYAEDQPVDWGRERNRKASYVYFVGCVGTYREEKVTMETLDLLDRLQVDYTLIDEACCSGVLEDMGYTINNDLAVRNTATILSTGANTVITGCPYCFKTFHNEARYAPLRSAGVDVVHLSQFLQDFDFHVSTDKIVTYHDPCDLGRHSGIYEEPRRTIQKIAPRFVELRHSRAGSLCCGAGGGVRAAYASGSIAMARRRLSEAEAVGAQVLLTECNSCIHNLENAKLRRQKFQILSTTQFINRLLQGQA
ncbi:MAG: (Fe-S)-binding protein [Desulfatiglandaceae bacterium]